jgi:membrane protein required for colicin V production
MGFWNWLDWTLAAMVAISVVAAVKKGFVREVISLAALVAGITVAALGYQRASTFFEDMAKSHELALALGFLTLLLAVLVLGALVSKLAQHLVNAAGLGLFNRFMGAAFGLVRGVLLDSIILLVMVAFMIKPQAVQESTLAPYVMLGANVLSQAMPKELKAEFQLGFGRFRQALQRGAKKADKN